jgi:MFS family permease
MMLSQISAFSNNFTIFMSFYLIAIFSVGWGDPLMSSTINSMITNEKFKATYFSINNSMSAFGEAMSYLALSYSLTSDKLHLGWQFGILGYGLSVIVFAGAVLLNQKFQLKPVVEAQ